MQEQTPGSGPSGVGVPAPVQRDSVVCKLGLGTVYGPSLSLSPIGVGNGPPDAPARRAKGNDTRWYTRMG